MLDFREICAEELENVTRLFSKDWALIAAGDTRSANVMVGGWGGAGYLWKKPVISCVIRPQRYTFELVEKHERFSLCFLPEKYRAAMQLCGTQSGRDTDKFAATGLTPAFFEGVPFVAESRLVIIARKMYADDLKKERFIDKEPLRFYEAGDFHRVYICEAERILLRQQGKDVYDDKE